MNSRSPVQVFLGSLLLAFGVVALLVQLDVITADIGQIAADWWPLVVIGVGVAALVTVPRAWVGPALIIAVGALFLLQTLDLVDFDVWDVLWPIAIIVVGLALLTRVGRPTGQDDVVNSTVVWWGSQRRSSSKQFRGGSLTALMGGIELDLRDADIVGRAEIAVFAMWAGVEIKVPPTWRVHVSGLPLLGGWENKTKPPADPNAPQLLVHITAVMGGVEIKPAKVLDPKTL